jgi:hypothetical protein
LKENSKTKFHRKKEEKKTEMNYPLIVGWLFTFSTHTTGSLRNTNKNNNNEFFTK